VVDDRWKSPKATAPASFGIKAAMWCVIYNGAYKNKTKLYKIKYNGACYLL
jgi:hypothetical protein